MPLRALVETLIESWQLGATAERLEMQNRWIVLLRDGQATLPDLLDAAERRYKELDRPKPPAFLLYVDQAEELYVRAGAHPNCNLGRFSRAVNLRRAVAYRRASPLPALDRRTPSPPPRLSRRRRTAARTPHHHATPPTPCA
jgi:hypothetical protein